MHNYNDENTLKNVDSGVTCLIAKNPDTETCEIDSLFRQQVTIDELQSMLMLFSNIAALSIRKILQLVI